MLGSGAEVQEPTAHWPVPMTAHHPRPTVASPEEAVAKPDQATSPAVESSQLVALAMSGAD